MAVIVSDMETYAEYMERAFRICGVPFFMDHKRSVLLNSFVEYLRSLLAMIDENFSYESTFRFLRTNLTGFTQEEVDDVENYVVALGIRGYKKWKEIWVRQSPVSYTHLHMGIVIFPSTARSERGTVADD